MTMRKQYLILNLLTSPERYGPRLSPCREIFPTWQMDNLLQIKTSLSFSKNNKLS